MQCKSCHKELAEGTKFCKFCGAKQGSSFSATSDDEEKQAAPYSHTESMRREAEIPPTVFLTPFTPQKSAEEKEAFEETSEQEQPIKLKRTEPKRKRRRWLPLVIGSAVMIVIVAVMLAIVMEKMDEGFVMQLDDRSKVESEVEEEETASDEFTDSFQSEAELSDGASAEGLEEQESLSTLDGKDSTESESLEETVEALYCIACGEKIPANALFCPYCGERQMNVGEGEPSPNITVSLGNESDVDSSRFSVLPIQSVDQSSVVVQSGTHDNTAYAAIDGRLETSWQEGVDGDGIGEWVYFDLGRTRTVQYLRLYLGNWRNSDWYSRNNVPKELEIEINGQTWGLEFPYEQEPCIVVWSAPVETDYVLLRIASVYEGSVYDDTCIAEVQIIGY